MENTSDDEMDIEKRRFAVRLSGVFSSCWRIAPYIYKRRREEEARHLIVSVVLNENIWWENFLMSLLDTISPHWTLRLQLGVRFKFCLVNLSFPLGPEHV